MEDPCENLSVADVQDMLRAVDAFTPDAPTPDALAPDARTSDGALPAQGESAESSDAAAPAQPAVEEGGTLQKEGGDKGLPSLEEGGDKDLPSLEEEGDEDLPSHALYDQGTVGLGVDIVEIERMRAILDRTPSFSQRVFSKAEQDYCNKKADPATHYALRFAAKEAVVKALGTGFADGIWVHDIEVVRNKQGKPSVALSGRAKEIAEEQSVRELSISLSYTHTEAVACALAITESAIRSTEKRKDPMEELARQFKETRGMLDEL